MSTISQKKNKFKSPVKSLTLQTYLSILIDGKPRRIQQNELPHVCKVFDDVDIYWCPQFVNEHAQTAKKRDVDRILNVVLDLDFDLADREFGVEDILERIKKLSLPQPTIVVFSGGGYHVYWTVAPITITKQRQRWTLQYETLTRKLCSLFEDLGADPASTNLNRLFRVLGSWNQERKDMARIVWTSDSQTTLEDLGQAAGVKEPEPTLPGIEPPIKIKDLTGKVTSSLKCLIHRKFSVGYRNQVILALTYALRLDGYSYTDTLEWLVRWSKNHIIDNDPNNHYTPIRYVTKSVYSNELRGLSATKLREIEDVTGWSMPAYTAFKAQEISGRDGPGGLVPLRDRVNRPMIESLGRILSVWRKGQLVGATNSEATAICNVSAYAYESLKSYITKLSHSPPYWDFRWSMILDIVSMADYQDWWHREPGMMRWLIGVINGCNGLQDLSPTIYRELSGEWGSKALSRDVSTRGRSPPARSPPFLVDEGDKNKKIVPS